MFTCLEITTVLKISSNSLIISK